MEDVLVVKQSKSKLLLGFFGSLGFSLLGLVMLRSTGFRLQIGGMATVLFFGIAAAMFAWRVIRTEYVVLTVDRQGFTDFRLFDGPVPWSQVQAARGFRIYGSQFIELSLRNPECYPGRGLSRLNAWTGWSPHIINLGFLDRPADEVVLAFEGFFEDYIRRSGLTDAVRPARLGAGISLQTGPLS